MSLRINLNDAAMNASRNLATTNSALGKSIERLSSGYKINRGSDDPAGLVISENLRAQISGFGQAIANSQDGVNLVKTAEGALTEVNSLLNSMRTLAVHAANAGALDSTAVSADQTQISSAITSLDNIAVRTAFGTKKLLDGSGAQTFTINKPNLVKSFSMASTSSQFAGATGSINLTVGTQATQATVTGNTVYANLNTNLGAAGDVIINGVKIGSYTTADTIGDVVKDINDLSSTTGVTASFANGAGVTLKQASYGSAPTISLGDAGELLDDGTTAVTAGANAAITAITIAGASIYATNGTTWTSGSGNLIQNNKGDKILLADGLAAGAQTSVATLGGAAFSFQVGANSGETSSVSISSTKTTQLGAGVTGNAFANLSAVDVTTNATDAIKVIDAAISEVSTMRAKLGAFQKNVLESNINSLGVAKENVAASESSIRDTDMAAEMVQFTRFNILQQAGTAMLTQANQSPQQLLSLLR